MGDHYPKYLADCAADKASGAGERFPADEERIMHYRSGEGALALRTNRLKIMMSEGLSPNAADAKKETLLFLVLKARVSRELKYEMINYLFSQGASAIVINSDGCEPGGLLAHDTEMQNFLSDVCVLQEEDQPFHDRILSFAEEMTESVDRYQINQRTRIQSILYQLFMYNPKTLAMRDEEKIKYRDIVAEIRIKHFMIEALIKQVMLVYDQSYWGPLGKTTLHGPVKKHVEAFRACEPYGIQTKKIASERPIYSQRVARQMAEAYRSKDEEVMRRDRQIAELLRRMEELESNAGSSRRSGPEAGSSRASEPDAGSSRRPGPEGRDSDASHSVGLFRSIPASAEVSSSAHTEVLDGSARATMS